MMIDWYNAATSHLNRALDGISYCAATDLTTPIAATARIALPLVPSGAQL
jgi:hypothetical protein